MLRRVFLFSNDARLDPILKLILGVVSICLLAPLSIPLDGPVDITLQTLIILLVATLFGMRIGVLSTILYIICGVLGLPVFAGHASGPDVILGPTGGFFFGFIAAAALSGYFSEKSHPRKFGMNLAIWIGAHLVILLLGFFWLSAIVPDYQFDYSKLEPLIPGIFIKSAVGLLITHMLYRFLRLRNKME